MLRGASGGHSDTAAGADLTIITAPLVRGRIPCVVEKVLTRVTPGASVDVLVTDHGIAVNPARQDLIDNLRSTPLEPVITLTLKSISISSALSITTFKRSQEAPLEPGLAY